MSLMNASWFTKLNMFPYLIRNIHIYPLAELNKRIFKSANGFSYIIVSLMIKISRFYSSLFLLLRFSSMQRTKI